MPVDRKSLDNFLKNFAGVDSHEKEEQSFAKRILTYIEGQKWVGRPLVMSPAICSQYGWMCKNSNLLECETCGAKLSAPEPKIELYEAYKACVEKTLKNLKSSHKAHCPWPITPAPECFVKMLSMPKEESLKHFSKRLKSSLEFQSHFPQMKEGILSLLGLEKQHVVALCKLAGIDDDDANEFGESAVSLASTGWTLKTQGSEQKILISCDNCQRSVWSKAYNLIPNDDILLSQDNKDLSITEDTPSNKIKRLKKENFDPLEEHRPWCLWIATEEDRRNFSCKETDSSSESTEEINKIPGWKIFIKSLLGNVDEPQESELENTPSKEQIRNVKDLLDTWGDIID
ncbi:zinc finger C3HC-type protein 1-like [Argiope bruennichi]|uniref:NIPA-like protein like n=1 Tax=Argiope bruennichi TaxID=94029 RepID=A0A8T0FNV3_ARGBR|nr:zinc finger C3HC-type protein 1-like [Argiope bruennichi]KAF8792242.1 NIPA-like protein like [Argiope bruennichi]